MKEKRWVHWIAWLGVALLVVSELTPLKESLSARAAKPATVGVTRWRRTTVVSEGDVGQYASVAIDPTTGQLQIAYYNATDDNLWIAYQGGQAICPGQNGNGWSCANWITADEDGLYASLAFQSDSDRGVAYQDATKNLGSFNGDRGDGDLVLLSSFGNYGKSNSLVYDANDQARVAYQQDIPPPFTGSLLSYAAFVGAGGNCGGGNAWNCWDIDYGPSGTNPVLALDLDMNFLNFPTIAYAGDNHDLKFAQWLGSGGNCGDAAEWQCDVIDTTTSSGAITHISLYLPKCFLNCGSLRTQIAYIDTGNGTLKYAHYVGGNNGNCGFGSQLDDWQCDVIDFIGAGADGAAMAVNTSGMPTIAYQDADDQLNGILKLARPLPFGGLGNCGPGLPFFTWRCEVMDSGLRVTGGLLTYHNVGSFTSIALNPGGLATAAYYDVLWGDLLIISEYQPVFLPLVRR